MARLSSCPLGIYEKALPSDPGSFAGFTPDFWSEILTSTRDLGFDFLEMSIDESPERLRRVTWTPMERRQFRTVCLDVGMRVPSICLSGNRKFPIGSSDPDTCSAGISLITDAIDLADDLGVRVLQLAGYDVYYGEESTASTRERFCTNLETVIRYAASRGVMLSMEVMDTRFMSSISRFLYFRRRLPSPWFTVYPDVGNLSAWNDNALEELDLGLGLGVVAAVHLKDTYRVTASSPGQFRDVPFGRGCVDFPGMFRVLRAHNYQGPLLLEMWNRGDRSTDQVAGAREWVLRQLAAADAAADGVVAPTGPIPETDRRKLDPM